MHISKYFIFIIVTCVIIVKKVQIYQKNKYLGITYVQKGVGSTLVFLNVVLICK